MPPATSTTEFGRYIIEEGDLKASGQDASGSGFDMTVLYGILAIVLLVAAVWAAWNFWTKYSEKSPETRLKK